MAHRISFPGGFRLARVDLEGINTLVKGEGLFVKEITRRHDGITVSGIIDWGPQRRLIIPGITK